MKRFFPIAAALLLCNAGALAQYTNILDGGTEQTVTNTWTTNTIWVGTSSSNNSLYVVDGGAVTATNVYVGSTSNATGNTVAVTGTGTLDVEDTLEIGTGTNNTVSVSDGGTITAGNLIIHSGNALDLNNGGTLSITGDYDADAQANVNWAPGGTLSVGGELTKSSGLDGVDRTLTLNGGSWTLATDLNISGVGNTLKIVNGSGVTNNNAFIGTASSDSGNTVWVMGANSSWTINGALQIGAADNADNSVNVADGGVIEADVLDIQGNNSFNLNNSGTLAMTGDFNAAANGFSWYGGGKLSVSGDLSGMDTTNLVVNGSTNSYGYLADGRDLTLDGGAWDLGGTNLIVGLNSSGSDLVITNGGKLDSASGYIGWGTNASSNTVVVTGSGSEWRNIDGLLHLGDNSGAGNSLNVSAEAWVYIGEVTTADFAAGAAGGIVVASTNGAQLIVDNGSTVETTGGLYIGSTNSTQTGRVEVRNNSKITADTLMLNTGSDLSLKSGGSISLGSSMMVNSNTSLAGSGTIQFGDNNSVLSLNGPGISISPNLLFDGGLGADTISVTSNGTFTVAGTSSLQYTNFQTLVLSDSTLAGYGILDGFTAIDMTGGMIDPYSGSSGTAILTIDGTFTAASGTLYRAQVYDNGWDQLVFTGTNAVNISGMAAEVSVVTAPSGTVTILSATNLEGTFANETVVDRLLLFKAVLQVTNNEVQVYLEEDPLGASMEFASTEMIRAGFNGMKNSVFTRTKQLRRNLVSTAHAIPNEVYLLTNTNAPAGAMGPGDQNTIFDMHVWMQQYSGQGDFDGQGSSDGFALNNQGTTIGADRLIGDALILGFNYTYARSSARTTGMDDLDAETYWLGAYGEWVGEQGLYVDTMAAFGLSNYDAQRREEYYLGTASYSGQAFGAYADVGQYYYHGNLALSPYAGIHVLSLLADGHSETEKEGSTVYVDEVSRDMVESAIGLKMRHRFDTLLGRFQTTGFAEWTHDFIEDDVSATLTAQGYDPISTGIISPDVDTVNVGLGYSWISTDYLEVGIGYNGRFSENYEEHTGALMLDIMF